MHSPTPPQPVQIASIDLHPIVVSLAGAPKELRAAIMWDVEIAKKLGDELMNLVVSRWAKLARMDEDIAQTVRGTTLYSVANWLFGQLADEPGFMGVKVSEPAPTVILPTPRTKELHAAYEAAQREYEHALAAQEQAQGGPAAAPPKIILARH